MSTSSALSTKPPRSTRPPTGPTTTGDGFWEVIDGGMYCHIVHSRRCVSDGEGNYAHRASCTFKALRPLLLTTLLYQVERGHDYLTVDGVKYDSGKAPAQGLRVRVDAVVTWTSDYSVSYAGFKICANGVGTSIGPVPTESTMSTSAALSTKSTRSPAKPTTTSDGFWQIIDGGMYCQIIASTQCVSDGEGNYAHRASCTLKTLRPLLLTTLLYQVERGHDYLTVDGVKYNSGKAPAQGLRVPRGAVVTWTSDYSVSYAGFKICANGVGTSIGPVPTESTMSTSAAVNTKPAATTDSPFWEVVSGDSFCHIVNSGRCVSDGEGNYVHSETCVFKALRRFRLSTLLYQVERGHDFLTVGGVSYSSGKAPPQDLQIEQGTQLVWKTDCSVQYSGFKVCAAP